MMGTFYDAPNDYRNYLAHHGVKGQKWGVKNGPPYPIGSSPRKVFISGTSKIKLKDSEYYRKSLPKEITSKIDSYMKDNNHILIGDAPGIDTEVQKYLAKKGYRNVTVYTISEGKPRSYWDDGHLGWGIKNVEGTEQVDKDKVMSKDAHTGFAVILEDGAKATRNNIDRMRKDDKDVEVVQLNKDGSTSEIFSKDADKANDIYNTLPYIQRFYVNPQGAINDPEFYNKGDKYLTKKDYSKSGQSIYSRIESVKGTPMSAVDVFLAPDNIAELAIMTRSGSQGKGYGKRALKEAVNYVDSHPEIKQLIYGVYEDNKASQHIAEAAGLKLADIPDYAGDGWLTYLLYDQK